MSSADSLFLSLISTFRQTKPARRLSMGLTKEFYYGEANF
jgi:hypothetical protein